jgi:multiple antibiotic resistance protein
MIETIDTTALIMYMILCVTSLFVIINPFSTVAVFIPLAKGIKEEDKKEMLMNSSKLGWAILVLFSLSGLMIFQLFGLSIGSFKIAGGILLLIISIKMIFKGNEMVENNNTEEFKEEFTKKEDLTVIPLTIPFTSGPGAITSAIVLASQATTTYHWVILIISITIAIILNYLVLLNSTIIEKILKPRGIKVLTKLIGIIICSVGIQFIVNGLIDLIPFVLTKIII